MQQYKKTLGKVMITPEGAWRDDKDYDILAIVNDNSTDRCYISKCYVPIGVTLDNSEYWMPLNVAGYSDTNFMIISKKRADGQLESFTIETAIASIAEVNRKVGCIICFFNNNTDRLDIGGSWEIWQFNDTNLYNWNDVNSWVNIYYNYNKFVGWFANEAKLKTRYKYPHVGMYAYVGTQLNEAVVYRCDVETIWSKTSETAKDYVKVIVKGNVSIGENGNWFVDGIDTCIPASIKGDNGKTPYFRNNANKLEYSYDEIAWYEISDYLAHYYRYHNNKLQHSNDNIIWEDVSDYISAWFRWSSDNKIQISRDGSTWTNLSNTFTDNVRIQRYIGVNESLPTSNIAEGTIYMKGPYYAEDDTLNDNPIYRMWIYAWKGNTLAWQDNGEFQSIAAGVVQETGNSETEVMSQKAVSTKLSELGSEVIEITKTNEIIENYLECRNGTLAQTTGNPNVLEGYSYTDFIEGFKTDCIVEKNGILIGYSTPRYYSASKEYLGYDVNTIDSSLVFYTRFVYDSNIIEGVVLRVDGKVFYSNKYRYNAKKNAKDIENIIESESDNLIDSSLYIVGGLDSNGSVDTTITSQRVTPFIDCHQFNALHLAGGSTRDLGITVYDYTHTKIEAISFVDNIAVLPKDTYYFRRVVMTSTSAEEVNLDIRGVRYNIEHSISRINDLELTSLNRRYLVVDSNLFEVGSINSSGEVDESITTQKITPYILCKGYKKLFISGYNRLLLTYFYDKELNLISKVDDVKDFPTDVPNEAYYLRRIVKTYGYDEDVNLSIEGYYKKESDLETDTGFVDLNIESSQYEDGGMNGGFNEYSTTQRRTPYIACENLKYVWVKNYTRTLGLSFYDKNKYPIKNEGFSTKIPVPKGACYLRRVIKTYGYEEEVDLHIKGYYNGETNSDVEVVIKPSYIKDISSIVKPEDFEGETMAEKVKAANNYILNAKGGFVLYFGDSSEYEITEAISIPSNTIVKIDNCTIRMADNVIDNIFRSANIIPNPSNYHGYGIGNPLETIYNIKIIGEGNAKIIHCNNTEKSGALSVGWRGITLLFWNVEDFEVGGYAVEKNLCWSHTMFMTRYGSVHDIVYNTTRENGDGLDIGGGCHDINIYRLSGSTEDDVMAIANSDETRLGQRPAEQSMPMHPYNYGIYIDPIKKFQTYNIYIDDIQVSGGGYLIDFLADAADVYNIHASNLSDVLELTENSGVIRSWASEYGGGYVDGYFHDIYINNLVQKNKNAQQAIWLAGMFHNSQINNVVLATSQTNLLRNESGIEPEDVRFVITNVK